MSTPPTNLLWNRAGTQMPVSTPAYLLPNESGITALNLVALPIAFIAIPEDWGPEIVSALAHRSEVIGLIPESPAHRKRIEGFLHDLAQAKVPVRCVPILAETVRDWAEEVEDVVDLKAFLVSNVVSFPPPSENPGTSPPATPEASAAASSAQEGPHRKGLIHHIHNTPYLEERLVGLLPRSIADLALSFKDLRQRDVFVLASLGAVSSALSNVVGKYANDLLSPNLFLFAAAPPASGKGSLGKARVYVEGIEKRLKAIHAEDLREWKKRQKQKKSEEGDGDEEDPEPVRRRLILAGNTSGSALARALRDNEGAGLIIETEADTLADALGKEWGSFSDLLRVAFQNEPSFQLRNNEEREIPRPSFAVVLSGTPNQLTRLLPEIENGLVSRFMFYVFVATDYKEWKSGRPSLGPDTSKLTRSASKTVQDLYFYLQAEKEVRIGMDTSSWDTFDAQLATLKTRLAKHYAYDGAGIANRIGLQGFKLIMTMAVLREWEQKGTLPSKLLATPDDVNAALSIVRVLAEHVERILSSLPKSGKGRTLSKPQQELWDKLPLSFSRAGAQALRGEVSERTVDGYLRGWVHGGLAEKDKAGHYRKVE